MTPEAIAAIFTGLTGLVAALAAVTANSSRRARADQRWMKKRIRKLEKWVLAYTQHTFELEVLLTQAGVKVPPRPPELDEIEDDDEDEEPAPSAGPIRKGAP